MKDREMADRKSQHIDICLHNEVKGRNITTGFEQYRFIHQAFPELDFEDICIHTEFLSKSLATPFFISSMTGGTEKAMDINRNLAIAAEECGWALALGSTRAAIEKPEIAYTFQVRKYAPTIPIIANLGAVQLNYGYGVEACKRMLEVTEADALVFHVNSLQEVFQMEGNTNFKGLLGKIEAICKSLDVPVGIKEVGWGINGSLARQLSDCGISFVDVAGAGGTSWSQVEKYRSKDALKVVAADAFLDWGIPTADCIVDCRKQGFSKSLLASGGIETGVEAAKAISLGADMVGFGRKLLQDAIESVDHLRATFQRIELEMKIAMFGIGVRELKELKDRKTLIRR